MKGVILLMKPIVSQKLSVSQKEGIAEILKAVCVRLANKVQMYNAKLILHLRHSAMPASMRTILTDNVTDKGIDESISSSPHRLS